MNTLLKELEANFKEDCEQVGATKERVKKILTAIKKGMLGDLDGSDLFLLWDELGSREVRNMLEEAVYIYVSFLWERTANIVDE